MPLIQANCRERIFLNRREAFHMRRIGNILGSICVIFAQGCFAPQPRPQDTLKAQVESVASADNDWKNLYGISWRGTPADNIKYAKQMGYEYIAIQQYHNKNNYIGNRNCAGLKFYVVDPQYWAIESFGYLSVIDTTRSYTPAEIAFYNQNLAWKSRDSFPSNMATGWLYADSNGNPTKFNAMWDVQQQAVIDRLVEKIIAIFHSYEDNSLPFAFAGYMVDVTRLSGDFNRWDVASSSNTHVSLSYWTGTESSLTHDTITHEYPTYADGMAAYYKQLNARMKAEFPNAKWILEPYWLYYTNNNDEWINQIKNRADGNELTPDLLFQEGAGIQFVDDSNIFNSGIKVKKDMVGISHHTKVGEYENRLYAAKAGINGGWYAWFGSFGESASGASYIPDFQNVTEVYPRLKLARSIPGWDNLNDVSLSDRSWDGSVYQSTKSYIGDDVMYSRHPKTGKLFAVFNTTNGIIRLNAGEAVISMQRTNEYFIESGDASADFNVVGNEIRIKSAVVIDRDLSNGQIKGRGYIFTLP